MVAARPYHSLTDFWHRARVSRPVVERLVLAGGFDGVYGIGSSLPGTRRRGKVTRRDLLLQVADLDRHACGRPRLPGRGSAAPVRPRRPPQPPGPTTRWPAAAATRWSREAAREAGRDRPRTPATRTRPAVPTGPGGSGARPPDSPGRRGRRPVTSVLALDLGDTPVDGEVSGLPEMNASERVRAELEILGLDASRHVVDFYSRFPRRDRRDPGGRPAHPAQPLRGAGGRGQGGHPDPADPFRAPGRLPHPRRRHRSWTRPSSRTSRGPTPPRCSTPGCSWSRVLRRTGRHGISLRATGCWGLPTLHELWRQGGHDGVAAVRELMAQVPEGFGATGEEAVQGAAESPGHPPGDGADPAGGRSGRLRHPGRRDGTPPGPGPLQRVHDVALRRHQARRRGRQVGAAGAPRKLWHSSPGSSGG